MLKDIKYIGVDIAKEKFDICLHNGNYSNCVYESYINNIDGFNDFYLFLESITHFDYIRIGLEATSTYMINFQKFLDEKLIRYIVINPTKIFYYKKYHNYENKTDKQDSYYISDYITTLDDSKFNSSHSKVAYLYKGYQSAISFITKSETHIKALNDSTLSDEFISDSLKAKMLELNKILVKTKSELQKEHILAVKIGIPEYEYIKKDLIGVGDNTLLAVLPLIYDKVDVYSVKQLQSYIGLNPIYRDSGSSLNMKQKISKAGNSLARKMLYMSALSSIQHNPELKLKYARLIDNGKSSKVAMVAISAHIFRAIVHRLVHYKALNRAK